jgi:DNA-binding beta-propeller fold protein YncE
MATIQSQPVLAWELRKLTLGTKAGYVPQIGGVAAAGRLAYAAISFRNPENPNDVPGLLAVIENERYSIVANLNIGQNAFVVAYNVRLNHIYVAHVDGDGNSGIAVVDAATQKIIKQLALPQSVGTIAVDGPRLRIYAANSTSDKVLVINADTFAMLPSITLKPGIRELATDTQANRLYASIFFATPEPKFSAIAEIEASSGTVLKTREFPAGQFNPGAIAINTAANQLYVAHIDAKFGSAAPNITVLDRNLSSVATIPTPGGALALVLNAALNQLYAATERGVHVINTNNRELSTTIRLDETPRAVAVQHATEKLYIGGMPGNQVLAATPLRTTAHDLALLRSDDLLNLEFAFVNLTLQTTPGQPARLVRQTAGQPAFVIVHFPPQSLAEEAFDLTETIKRPARSRMARASRLAFKLPDTLNALPYTVEALLQWNTWEPVLSPLALPSNTPKPATPPPIVEPTAQQTAIEAPFRVVLSPNTTANWSHSTDSVNHDGFAELWHTRLGAKPGAPAAEPTLRAIWSPDFGTPTAPNPFDMALTPGQRHQFVRLMSDWAVPNFTPQPINADQFMLSALGVWMRTRGRWNPPAGQGLDIEEWRHLATNGRDQNVRVVKRGRLFPFGHQAVHVIITERTVEAVPNGSNTVVAALRQRQFIIVREPEKRYDTNATPYPKQGREMPISRSLRLTTTITPVLDKPVELLSPPNGGNPNDPNAFWVRVNSADLPFHFLATDVEGQDSEFTTALIFVSDALTATQTGFVQTEYLKDDNRRVCHVPGQRIAYAARTSSGQALAADAPTDTSLTTERMWFSITAPAQAAADNLTFLPTLEKADVRIPSVEQILGKAQTIGVTPFSEYLNHGLASAQNQGQVFAQFTQKLPLDLSAEKAGGLAAMALEYTGISQNLGPVAGPLSDLAKGTFNPAVIFGALSNAKLLGTISIAALLKKVFKPDQFPKMLTETIKNGEIPEKIVARLDWKPDINDVGPFEAKVGNLAATLAINARFEQRLSGNAPPTINVTGALSNFAINFLNVVRVNFQQLKFVAEHNKKLDIIADLAKPNGVEFLGALSFLNEIQKYIPFDGFSDPPSLDVSPRGVDVGYSLGLPPLAVGVFALQNVTLGANLYLPFIGEPARLRFNFAERHSPFQVTVSMFSGGGFFALDMALDRVIGLEASLEFGGSISINLGVASGGVYVMAGIYFKLAENSQTGKNEAELSGYLRCGGALKVLGLICISVEFYMALTYETATGKVRGQASLKVKVSIAFFSKSVTLKVERSFGGSSGDPTFGQLVEAPDWQAYATAFA